MICIITNKQREWLQKTQDAKYVPMYNWRIQSQIDKNLNNALWLAKNYPEILLNEKAKIRHERLQKLLLLIKILKPEFDVYLEVAKQQEESLPTGCIR